MSVLLLTVFVSLFLVVFAVMLFLWMVRSHAFEHADRLALLPLELGGAAPHTTSTSRSADSAGLCIRANDIGSNDNPQEERPLGKTL